MKTQTLELKEEEVDKTEKPIRFWKRQFQTKITKKQKIFDWIFGVILPVICVVADPIVFKGAMSNRGAALGEYKPFAYLLSFVSIVLMMLFLLFGHKLKWFNSVLSGLFLVGSSVCVIVGVLLLPLSLLGLVFLVGALGFTPLFSAFVYFRNSIRAIDLAEPLMNKKLLLNLIGVSAIFSFVVPYVFYSMVENSLDRIEFGSPSEIKSEVRKLKLISPLINFDRLGATTCGTAENETIAEKRKAFYELSGESPEELGMQYCGDW
ncbi:MAG: hypothetical protein AAB336_05450 [Acidobacteriota bacterium]